MAIDYYALIGVPRGATVTEVRQALAKQQREWNARQQAPDLELRHEAETRMRQLAEVRKILLNPESRATYDRELQPTQPQGPTYGSFQQPSPFQPPTPFQPPPISPPRFQPPPTQPPTGRSGFAISGFNRKKLRRWVWAGGGLIVLIAVISQLVSGPGSSPGTVGSNLGVGGNTTPTDTPSPTVPTIANSAAAIANVVAPIQTCAKAATAQPVNCPQQGSGQDSIHWTVYGNIGDGAEIVPSNRTPGQFEIVGNTVMTEEWSQNGTAQLQVVDVQYEGTVDSSGTLIGLGPLQGGIQDNTTKQRPADLTDAAAKAAVATAFTQCVAVHPPVWCPDQPQASSSDQHDAMKSNEDPLLTSVVAYDASFGVVHVSGSYSMTLSWTNQYGQSGTTDFSGNYDASLADNGGQPAILRIKPT